ncbi:hypothetical protein F5X99DRAFT_409629 [Biscogniauxia marginata]|nr:hypothetical protein F5X99DRAFT_409629 [Biscogniauxia marginata]
MSNRYEAFADAILKQAAQDGRAQPWKSTVDTGAAAPTEEWVKVPKPANNLRDIDMRAGASPAKTNALQNSMYVCLVATNKFFDTHIYSLYLVSFEEDLRYPSSGVGLCLEVEFLGPAVLALL